MITIYITILLIIVALIYGFFVYKYQNKNDRNFIDNMRKGKDIQSLRVLVINEKIGTENNKILSSSLIDNQEIFITNGFLVLTQPVLALYNKEICHEGVEGITWPIQINKGKIMEDKSLEIECVLPDDEISYTRFIFKGLTDNEIEIINRSLAFQNSELILNANKRLDSDRE
jgi:lipopolysaccharide export system protein LptC